MRNVTIIEAEQRSPEWHMARIGRLTGSCAGDMLATIKSGEAAARRDLRMRLVCERLTQQSQDDLFITAAMQRGIDCEPLAFAAYEAHTGQVVERTGFLAHDMLAVGCSLDGHVGDFDGILELKCPKSATHLKYLKADAGKVPSEHVAQITHNLWVTGAAWCDFMSWDDRFPDPLQVLIVRVTRDQLDLTSYGKVAEAFLAEVDAEYVALRRRSMEVVAA